MIAYLKGNILVKEETSVILEVHDVGYQVFLNEQLLREITVSSKAEFFIYQHIREDADTLFGFRNSLEKKLFLQLLSVSGIGPKSAMAFFDGMSAEQIIRSIASGDVNAINQIQGVGRKTAEKVVLELKDKIVKLFPNMLDKNAQPVKSVAAGGIEESFKTEIALALQSLGYSAKEIEQAIQKSSAQLVKADNVEDAIRVMLKNL